MSQSQENEEYSADLPLSELLDGLDDETQSMISALILAVRSSSDLNNFATSVSVLSGQAIHWKHSNEKYGLQLSLERFRVPSQVMTREGFVT